MADDPHNTSNVSDEQVEVDTKEDAETAAAREELKQTVISERTAKTADNGATDNMVTTRSGREYGEDKHAGTRAKTPERDLSDNQNDRLKDQVSSPKKKRAHDQLDEPKDDAQDKGAGEIEARRTDRSEPEKKRPRDGQRGDDELSKSSQEGSEPSPEEQKDATSATEKSTTANNKEGTPPVTSAAAFEKSGFAKLSAATTSPFGALGASTKSVFGGASASPSPFGALGATAAEKPPTPSLSFGNGGAASPFASLNGPSKGFGSPFGGSAFGSALSGAKPLSSFGKPGEVLKSDKPAKPFGAPESDAEDDGDDDDEPEAEAESEKEKDDAEKEDPKATAEEKKKLKLQRVVVDDGEAGEVTVLSVRAKMFYLDKITNKDGKEEPAWKERGVGNLKINVPEDCVSFDDAGAPVPGSFDASALEDDDDEEGEGKSRKVVRLIMRQDSTLRVILNTTIVRGMDFQEKSSLKATTILFTAFEGEAGKPTQIQMKMNAANAKLFLNEVEFIKRELES